MTPLELQDLEQIAYHEKGWEARSKLQKYLKGVTVVETPKNAPTGQNTRTVAQNNAQHLWFRQIATICQEAGVEADAVFSKTHNLQMTEENVKAMWKGLQRALFGTKSTTELKKNGEIDKLVDHFVRFFAENFELELPPFPLEDKNTKLQAVENAQSGKVAGMDYPDTYTGAPKF